MSQASPTISTPTNLPRTYDALLQDQFSHDEWVAALMPLRASAAIETEAPSYGVYVEHGVDGVRLHVPQLGTAFGVDEPHQQDGLIRAAIRAAAVALGLLPAAVTA